MSLDQTIKNQPSQADKGDRDCQSSGEAKQVGTETSNTLILPEEIGGFNGPEPTRYGDWEKNGRCVDF